MRVPAGASWAFLAPALVLLVAVIAVPLLTVLPRGLDDLGRIGRDPYLARITGNTLAFGAVTVVLEVVLGIAFALILHHTLRLRGLVRAAALLPWALPTAVMAMAWRWIFNDAYGVANDLPMRLGLLQEPVAWLARPGTAFFSVVLADVWKTTPFVTLLALAVVFRIIQALGIFDLIWVMTGGGPANATKTIAVYIYDQYFRFQEWGYGSALTLVAAAGMFLLAAGAGTLVRGRRPA